MKLKSSCCDKYERKGKACKSCPMMACLSKKERKRTLKMARKLLADAA